MQIFLTILVIVIAVLAGVIAMQPENYSYTRSAVFNAAPAAVFAQVNDFHKWEAWSPWAKLDPNAKNTFEGPAEGAGSSFAWDGNNQVGAGKMTITESTPPSRIVLKLEFIKPFPGTSQTEFTFMPEGNGTKMTWTMSGKNNFIGKAMGLIMNCEKMIGEQFEKGLSNLKAVVER
jgi:uncharacterized protein YndB with AHSA1/START domain